jgi:hypothetical protein
MMIWELVTQDVFSDLSNLVPYVRQSSFQRDRRLFSIAAFSPRSVSARMLDQGPISWFLYN